MGCGREEPRGAWFDQAKIADCEDTLCSHFLAQQHSSSGAHGVLQPDRNAVFRGLFFASVRSVNEFIIED